MLHAALKNPPSNTTQNSNCAATYHPSYKPSKKDERDMLGTAEEAGMDS